MSQGVIKKKKFEHKQLRAFILRVYDSTSEMRQDEQGETLKGNNSKNKSSRSVLRPRSSSASNISCMLAIDS